MSQDDQDRRDALAYVRCVLTNDGEGVRVLSTYLEPGALEIQLAVLAACAFGGDRTAALAGIDAEFARLDRQAGSP